METGARDGFGGIRSGRVSRPRCGQRCLLLTCGRSSAVDEISHETVAIKLVTRVFEKVQLAKRALREITLLRHFTHHENITGLIDVDAISPDFQEMCVTSLSLLSSSAHSFHRYIFMEVSLPSLHLASDIDPQFM